MSKKQVVGSMLDWSGVLKDFFRQINDGSLTLQQTTTFTEHRNPFELELDISTLVSDWQNFYKDVFGIKADFSNLRIPKKQPGFNRLIVMAKGMTAQKVYDKCKELFPCWKWTDKNLDTIVKSERTAGNDTYAIWIRNEIEADKELKSLSANDLKEKNILGITLEERFIYELKYFKETDKHLDKKRITLCTGSHRSDGSVPSVDWRGNSDFKVGRYFLGYRDSHFCSRQVISF